MNVKLSDLIGGQMIDVTGDQTLDMEVEVGRSAAGRLIIYIHVDGKTIFRLTGAASVVMLSGSRPVANIGWSTKAEKVEFVREAAALLDPVYEKLPAAFYLQDYPHMWTEKYFVMNDLENKDPSKGYREFTGPGGHRAGEYGYPVFRLKP